MCPGSVTSRPQLALELPLPLSLQEGVWHLSWPHQVLSSSPSFWWSSYRLLGCASLCFVVCFPTAGWPFLASGWELEEGGWFAPISTAVFTLPCQGLSGAPTFPQSSASPQRNAIWYPCGLYMGGAEWVKGSPSKGGWKEARKVVREEGIVQKVLFEFWEALSPSFSISGLKTSTGQKYT